MGNIFEPSLKDGEADIGGYRVTLTEDIGSGSFGTVFPAKNRKTGEKMEKKMGTDPVFLKAVDGA